MKKLMYINANAKGFKRDFNVMSRKIFEKILQNNPSMPRELLRCSFCPFDESVLEDIEDEVERTIKYAIHVVKDDPEKRSLILTSDEKQQEYLQNHHYTNSKDVVVRGGDFAVKLIEDFWKECSER